MLQQALRQRSHRLQNNFLFASLQLSYQKTNTSIIRFITVRSFPKYQQLRIHAGSCTSLINTSIDILVCPPSIRLIVLRLTFTSSASFPATNAFHSCICVPDFPSPSVLQIQSGFPTHHPRIQFSIFHLLFHQCFSLSLIILSQASIHIMVHFCPVIAVYCGRSIKQASKQICPDIPHFCGILVQTF